MFKNDIINQLSIGILLQNNNTLLPWHSPFDSLRSIANPVEHITSDRRVLVWKNCSIFDGVNCQIEAVFRNKSIDVLNTNSNGKLNFVSLYFDNPEDVPPRELFVKVFLHFIEIIGKPSDMGENRTQFVELPYAKWNFWFGELVLMVFDRFGEYCVGHILKL